MEIIDTILKHDNSHLVANGCSVDKIFEVFRMLSYDELKDIVFKMSNEIGDNLNVEFTKSAYPYIAHKIINLVNSSLEIGIISGRLKIFRVIPKKNIKGKKT